MHQTIESVVARYVRRIKINRNKVQPLHLNSITFKSCLELYCVEQNSLYNMFWAI